MEIETPDDEHSEIHDDERPAGLSDVEVKEVEYTVPPASSGVEVEAVFRASRGNVEHTTLADVADIKAESVEPAASATEPETIRINLSPLITLVVGLGLGFLAGFVGRPYLASQQPALLTSESVAQSPAVTPTPASGAQASPTPESANASNAAAEDTAAREAAAQRVMDALIAQTRHFKGNPNAPVTMIEFSDFQ